MRRDSIAVICVCVIAVAATFLPGCLFVQKQEAQTRKTAQAKDDTRLREILKLSWFDRLPTLGVQSAYLLRNSIYVYTIEGILYRYDRIKGGVVWGSKIVYPLDGPPTRDGTGRLYTMAGGKLLALDEANGAVLGKRRVRIGPLNTVFPTAEALIYAGTDSSIHIINPATGYDAIMPNRIGANVLSIDSVTPDLVHMVLDTGHAAAYFGTTGEEAWRIPIGPKPIAKQAM